MQLLSVKCPDPICASKNIVVVSSNIFENQETYFYAKIINDLHDSTSMYKIKKIEMDDNHIGISTIGRTKHIISLGDYVNIEPIDTQQLIKCNKVTMKITKHKKHITPYLRIHNQDIKEMLIPLKYLFDNQGLYYDFGGGIIINIEKCDGNILHSNTEFEIDSDDPKIIIMYGKALCRDLFRSDYNFQNKGIGGLNIELIEIFRKALSTRALKPQTIKKLGIKHKKGIVLYGPPGTGKTLIGRKISGIISAIEPKIVNGPDILDKYVGESEKKIRELFSDAELDFETNKEQAGLHVIIFDEIDAICKTRGSGSSSTGVGDSIVNQLLTKIDGIKQIDNVFIIAITNRFDMLDPALLRAGRLELHVKVGLPSFEGRREIFQVHMKSMMDNSILDHIPNFDSLAKLTQGYTGAEIEALVNNSMSIAVHRLLNENDNDDDNDNVIITLADFMKSISEFIPQFGNSSNKIIKLLDKYPSCDETFPIDILNNDRQYTIIINRQGMFMNEFLRKLYSVKSDTVKIITEYDLIGKSDSDKITLLQNNCHECYEADNSIFLMTNVNNLIGYMNLSGVITFSNNILQTLISIINTYPIYNNKMTIILSIYDEDLLNCIYEKFSLDNEYIIIS
jgi:vesicle-fusing ATPase